MTSEAVSRPKIPGKLYFRIGEVTEITGVQPYTLRHWESEFPTLNPKKNDAGQRLYRRAEIEMVLEIQRLLHHEGYTTAGARRLLSQRARTKGSAAAPPKPAAPARPASPESAPAPAASGPSVEPTPAAGGQPGPEPAPASVAPKPATDEGAAAPAVANAHREAARRVLALMEENDRRLADLLGPSEPAEKAR